MFKFGHKDNPSQKSKRSLNFIKEKFHHIQTSLQFSRNLENNALRSIVITSGSKGEGKSFCAWNLGKSLASNNRRVLLVDGDMYKAKLSKKLNTFEQIGLSDILISEKNPLEFISETVQPGLFILPTGILPPNPIKLINSERMLEVIKLLEENFDMVIIDTPPVLLLSDSRIIGNMCDGVIVIIRSGLTKKMDLEVTMEFLSQANTHVIGTILNGRNYGRNEMNSYSYY
ncbi:polysaccharide biosynthesis tyrosine autokinase [Bacillus cereus group sp. RP43]|uniref:tyrosine-protein kinase family protein n=1 Tax=Bacillus cereus group sp. RP43 TaxID=3040260 RepID=UPI0033966E6C